MGVDCYGAMGVQGNLESTAALSFTPPHRGGA